ncbi:MAG: M48 family metallopeptidase [Lachnospiraceae bacterium]
MDTISQRAVIVEGREILYSLERKPVRNLNLRVRKDGRVYVSADAYIPCGEIDAFVVSKAPHIQKALDHFHEMAQYRPQPKQYVSGETFTILGRGLRLQVTQAAKESISADGIYIQLGVRDLHNIERKRRIVNRFLDQQCRMVFCDVMDMLYPSFQKYGVQRPSLRIRDMETRWGSCLAKKGIITLNKRLLEAPRHCIEYVVMHELCHMVHPNHSRQFYVFLTMLMPDWKERKQYLDKTAVYWL